MLQAARFRRMDAKSPASMMRFAAVCSGLPRLYGTDRIEEWVREFLQAETGEMVVGVSVCWGFVGKEVQIGALAEQSLGSAQDAEGAAVDAPPVPESGWLRFVR